jgi:hypothetical protein
MKKITFVIPILLLMVTLFSCGNKTTTENTDTIKVADSTLINLKSLRDSSDKAWDMMTKSDDQKISDIARLLQEISYCKKYNAMLLDSLNTVVKVMKDKRYSQLAMTNEQIDQYDIYTDKVISRVRFLSSSTKDLKEHPLAETLFSDIAEADNTLWSYRKLYDKWADKYNSYLEANKNSLGDKAKDYPKLMLFSIQQPS